MNTIYIYIFIYIYICAHLKEHIGFYRDIVWILEPIGVSSYSRGILVGCKRLILLYDGRSSCRPFIKSYRVTCFIENGLIKPGAV